MEYAANFMCVLASSSLWLAGSGLVLWLCLRSRLRLSPGTRAVASILVVLQGCIWIGIPVQVDPAWIDPSWIDLQPIGMPVQKVVPIDAMKAMAPLPIDAQLPLTASSMPASINAAEAATTRQFDSRPLDSRLPFAASTLPYVMPMAGASAVAIWMAGIVIILWRSICAFIALSRMVHALPLAPVEWQNEFSALCAKQNIGGPLALKTSNLAPPMLVQTWKSACIVVPAWLWESCTAEQRTSILLHELAHYRRGDVWRQLAMRLLVLPHWLNPVAWWAARQFEAANEAACDDAACGGEELLAISYSKALLILNERPGIRYAQALAISGSSLTERIRRILHPEFQKESQMSRFLILSAMIVLTSLATIRIRAADESVSDEPAKAPAASLLANGGFEVVEEGSGDPKAWSATRWPKTPGHYILAPSSIAHGGKRSVVVEIGDSHPDTRVDYNWTTEAQGWKAGETYELSGWIKVENAKDPAFIMVQCWNEETKQGKMIGGAWTEPASPVKGTTDWTKVSTRFVVPEGTGVVRIRAGLSSQSNKGAKAWLDDLSLVAVPRSANESNKNESAKSGAAAAPVASLLANGGFEEVQENSNDPQAWFGTRIPQTAGHFLLASSSVAHSGKRSAVVEIGDSHPDRKVAYNWTAVAEGWKAGETYDLSGWIKTENVKHTAFIMAQFWSEDGMVGGATTQFTSPVKGTTDWTRVRTRLKVPEGTKVVRIRAGLSSKDNRGAKAWLDDLSLVKVASN